MLEWIAAGDYEQLVAQILDQEAALVDHSTISRVVEHPELVADRLISYARAVGRENVIAGTDCGLGGRVHPQIARAKLNVLAEGARLATARLWC
jgi:5-methyltetrahydropteroyltriglutamate--homocysteine methyltransferase